MNSLLLGSHWVDVFQELGRVFDIGKYLNLLAFKCATRWAILSARRPEYNCTNYAHRESTPYNGQQSRSSASQSHHALKSPLILTLTLVMVVLFGRNASEMSDSMYGDLA